MKKKILIIATVAILLSLMAYGTLAYFNASATAVNKVTMGNIDAKVVETTLENGKEVAYPTDPVAIMPGAVVSKIVRVENTGSASAWIRAKVEITATTTTAGVTLPTGDELAALLTINFDTTKWSKGTDGWYYYADQVAASGNTATALFDKVTFSGAEIGNDFENATIEINVVADAVQSANNGTTVSEAAGWPNS